MNPRLKARRAELARMRQIRENACSLSIDTIGRYNLFVKSECDRPKYFDLLRQCDCADGGHRKRKCPLHGMGYCPTCRCACPKGTLVCGLCQEASDATMKLRSDFFLEHFADRAAQQQGILF